MAAGQETLRLLVPRAAVAAGCDVDGCVRVVPKRRRRNALSVIREASARENFPPRTNAFAGPASRGGEHFACNGLKAACVIRGGSSLPPFDLLCFRTSDCSLPYYNSDGYRDADVDRPGRVGRSQATDSADNAPGLPGAWSGIGIRNRVILVVLFYDLLVVGYF